MAVSNIEWTKYTFNPWTGCMKVSDGCKYCYAEILAKRRGWVKDWGTEYHQFSENNWKKPKTWDKNDPGFVFCASLGDYLDAAVPMEWTTRLFELVWDTPNLTWLMLTKRPQNYMYIPPNPPPNFWFGVTVENNEIVKERMTLTETARINRDIKHVFVSAEPLLNYPGKLRPYLDEGIVDWVIVGGESGSEARPFQVWWARELLYDCMRANVPFFMKQMGTWWMRTQSLKGKGNHLEDIPEAIRVRQFPQVEEAWQKN